MQIEFDIHQTPGLPHQTPNKHKTTRSHFFNDTSFDQDEANFEKAISATLQKQRRLGTSQSSDVWLVTKNDIPCALKILNCTLNRTKEAQAHALGEYHLGNTMQHPQLVKYHDLFHFGANIAFLIEFCDMGSLDQYLGSEKYREHLLSSFNDIDKFWYFAYDILSALNYIHEVKAHLHLDIKPANIFISKKSSGIQCTMKLGDFGSMWNLKMKDPEYLDSGDGRYQAPEIAGKWQEEKQRPTKATDVYSLGLVFLEMLKQTLLQNPSKIEPEQIDELFQNDTQALSNAQEIQLKAMITVNPTLRPSVPTLLALPLMVQIQKILSKINFDRPRQTRSQSTNGQLDRKRKLPVAGTQSVPEKKKRKGEGLKLEGKVKPFQKNLLQDLDAVSSKSDF